MMSSTHYVESNSRAMAEEGAQLSCMQARQLCDQGQYEQAAAALAGLWAGVGSEPRLADLSPHTTAAVLLATGMVAGHLTKAQQRGGGQEGAKDLMSRALRQYTLLGDEARVCDAQIILAACYLREHAFDDARLLLQGALESPGCRADEQLRLRVLLGLAKAEAAAGRHTTAISIYEESLPLVAASDKLHQGNFYNDYGAALLAASAGADNKHYQFRAAAVFQQAAACFNEANHPRYAAWVDNNRALLLHRIGQGRAAHAVLDQAEDVLLACNDLSGAAQVRETRAQILLTEKCYAEAIAEAHRAVATLTQGDEYGLLTEALTTYATALARAGRYTEAVAEFARAQALADERIGGGASERIALTMIEELAAGVTVQSGVDFDTAVHRFEEKLIRHTLAKTSGRVSEAALRLGLTHQALTWMLKTRHVKLLSERTKIKTRKRSLIKHQGKLLPYVKKQK